MHDVHIHPISEVFYQPVNLNGLSTIAQYRVQFQIMPMPIQMLNGSWVEDGQWFWCWRKPSRKIIDELIPDRPVYQINRWPFWVGQFSRSEMAGLTNTPDPIDGIDRIQRRVNSLKSSERYRILSSVLFLNYYRPKIAGLKYSIKMSIVTVLPLYKMR